MANPYDTYWRVSMPQNAMPSTLTFQPVEFDPFAGEELLMAIPATESQQEIWLAVQMGDEANLAYNESLCLRFVGALDVEAMRSALQQLVQRHEALRSTFSADGTMLCVAAKTTVSVPLLDLSVIENADDRATKVRQLIHEETARYAFDLVHDCLFRAQILRISAQEHVLILNAHHLVCDGWSWGILLPELATLYSAARQGIQATLEPPKRFSDYALLQLERPETQEYKDAERYWLRQFSGDIPILDLPLDRPRPSFRTYASAREDWEVQPSLVADLKKVAVKAGCSFFTLLLTSFEVFLHRLSGQTDLVVGIPSAGQLFTSFDRVVGHCVNFLPIRSQVTGTQSFLDYMQARNPQILEAYDYQHLGFGDLVKKLALSRDPSRVPLAAVSFNLDRPLTGNDLDFAGLEVSITSNPRDYETFEIAINASEVDGQMVLECQYNTDLFTVDTIRRRLHEFETLLLGIVANACQPIAQLPILPESECQQLLSVWNSTQASYPSGRCLHQWFEAQVEKTPTAIAVISQDGSLTYQELNARANQLAHYLQQQGVAPDVLVALCIGQSIHSLVGILAILKAGGAFVPLDPTHPAERLAYILQDTAAPLLLTQSGLLENLPTHQARTICLDTLGGLESYSPANPTSPATEANLAYVIYTSGSTGKPKGVVIEQQAITQHCWSIVDHYQLTASDRILQFASFSFDASLEQVFPGLLAGAAVVLRDADLWSVEQLTENILSLGLSVLDLPPAFWQQWVRAIAQAPLTIANHRLRLVICGSDEMQAETLTLWNRSPLKTVRLLNAYGPTEATITATTCEVSAWLAEGGEGRLVPIGRPLPNRTAYVLDVHLQPVPIGVVGELYIGGASLARGYLNRPDLTAERFIPNPLNNADGGLLLSRDNRLYKTGDLARYLPDGNIEFLGRADFQVKVRGFRIELGDIEAALVNHPALREAVVVAREDQLGNKQLVAYVVPLAGQMPTTEELRLFLAGKLPKYMLPAAIVQLKQLPLTTTGKIDRRALPAPNLESGDRTVVFVAPRTPLEETLVNLWQEVLSIRPISIHDNFFDLGGHSLMAVQVVSRLREVAAIELPLRLTFETPTIADLATYLDKATYRAKPEIATVPAIAPILPASRQNPLPLSFAQQRLWFLMQLDPNSAAYNIPELLRLSGTLNLPVLEQSLNTIVQRHESLRTIFKAIDGEPIQVILPHLSLRVEIADLKAIPSDRQLVEVRQLAIAATNQPFNITQAPLLRAQLLQLQPEEHILIVVMHHIISDGWSRSIFVQELCTLYNALLQNQPSPLPALPIQYADFAVWQRQQLQGEVLAEQIQYWKTQLAGAPAVLNLPTDRPRPPVQTMRGAVYHFQLPKPLLARLERLSQQEGVTLFMTLLAAFQVLLGRYSGQEDIVVGSPIANRNCTEVESLIGFFVNTLVLRTDLSGDPSFQTVLKRVREVALGAYAHQDLPFEQLVEAINPERNRSYSPLFQVAFALQNFAEPSIELTGLTMTLLEEDAVTAKFDLTLFLTPSDDGLLGELEYSTDLFEPATIVRMAGHLQTLLESILVDPSQPIATLPLLTAAEVQHQLVDWNNTQAFYPASQCIHQLFAIQATQTPTAIAMVCDQQHLTYQQLNDRANQLAHHLRSLGVRPETLVGMCLDRSVEMIVTLLAILKAGGAYVPFDSNYPKERLTFMLEDTQVNILVTQQSLVQGLPPHTAQIVCLDTDRQTIAQYPTTNPPNTTNPNNLAYINYTSGSTGRPKGVCVPHQGVVRLVKNTNYARLTEEEVFLQLAPISFDAATLEIWGALLNGARLVVIPVKTPSLTEIGQVIRQHQVSILWLTAGLFHLMVDECLADLRSVRQLLAGGDVLSATHVKKVLETYPDCTVINGYGPTENTTFTCCYPMTSASQIGDTVPIGRPIANTQVYVLDNRQQPVPIGIPGELYTGGDGLARGYLNRPELTAERFVPNPLLNSTLQLPPSTIANRLYKTGDLVRYRPDGTLEFLGRIDNQVKIRGFRIELGEVETVLAAHPHVQAVVVIARQDTPGDKRLVAYVVPQPRQVTDSETLLAFLRDKLPSYMVPAAIVLMDEFPLTPNGKVDRKALPAPESIRRQTFVAPRNQLELQLTKIWQQVLGTKAIGVTDNFFAIGGHSLLAVRLLVEVEKVFHKTLPLSTIFQTTTIEQMASALNQSDWQPPCPAMVVIQSGGQRTPLFGIHVLGRGLEFYRPFSIALHPEQPVYGLSVQIMDKNLAPPNEVKDLATYYIREMQIIQPEGPYLLSGVSFGGVVAYEMAQQLHQQGQRVALLALLDTYPAVEIDTRSIGQRTSQNLSLLRQARFDVLLTKAKMKAKNIAEKIEHNAQKRRLQRVIQKGGVVEDDVRLEALYYTELNDKAMENYTPQPYPGRVVLFRCTDIPADDYLDPEAEWAKLAMGGVETYKVPGDHLGMLRLPENAVVLGKLLQSCIDKAVLQNLG